MPDVVPIDRQAGYYTDTIGRYRDGQFCAAVHLDGANDPDARRERVPWYLYLCLHLFDSDGHYNRSPDTPRPLYRLRLRLRPRVTDGIK